MGSGESKSRKLEWSAIVAIFLFLLGGAFIGWGEFNSVKTDLANHKDGHKPPSNKPAHDHHSPAAFVHCDQQNYPKSGFNVRDIRNNNDEYRVSFTKPVAQPYVATATVYRDDNASAVAATIKSMDQNGCTVVCYDTNGKRARARFSLLIYRNQ